MARMICGRIFQSLVTVLLLSLVTFVGIYFIGNPLELLAADLGTPDDMARATRELGLDQPLHLQYWSFLTKLAAGDFGKSFVSARPALDLILERLPATLELTFLALIFSIVIGLPLGMIAGVWPESFVGRAISHISILFFSLPGFWFAIVLIVIFAISLGWLPSVGRGPRIEVFGVGFSVFTWEGLRHMILPAIVLSLLKIALVIRLTKSGMQEALVQDYVRFARLRGISERRVIWVHAFRNILIPIITTIGIEFGNLLGGSTVAETIFAWPGIGKLLIDSIAFLDRPVIVAYMVLVVLTFVTINLVVDLLYILLDPRTRKESA
jgi:peptide/nickel transport system permease protein